MPRRHQGGEVQSATLQTRGVHFMWNVLAPLARANGRIAGALSQPVRKACDPLEVVGIFSNDAREILVEKRDERPCSGRDI